jgi:hypothetical protein
MSVVGAKKSICRRGLIPPPNRSGEKRELISLVSGDTANPHWFSLNYADWGSN